MKYILFTLILCLCCSGMAKLLPYDYALLSETENNSQFDLAWHAKLAGYGNPDSQFFMGRVYEEGKLVPENKNVAIKFYRKAAEQEHIESMMRLSDLIMEEKIYWLTKAAEMREISAQLKLSEIYESQGEKEKAIFWLEQAMRQMFPYVSDLTTVSPKLQELKAIP